MYKGQSTKYFPYIYRTTYKHLMKGVILLERIEAKNIVVKNKIMRVNKTNRMVPHTSIISILMEYF